MSLLEILFDVRDLRVTYRRAGMKPVEAVKGVSFTLAAGESLGVVGESGSGKSSLAKALMLLNETSGGVCLFRGKDISSFSRDERSAYRCGVQMVFQDAVGSLNPRMTVRQTLEEVLSVYHLVPSDKRSARISELLDHVGLTSAILDQYPRELSGGQCQRASFARALAMNPSVIIADEPVSALDVSVQARILNLLRDLQGRLGLSVLLIAHDLAVVRNVCDRVSVMHNGLFVESGAAGDVLDHPKEDYTRNLLAMVPDVARALAARRKRG